ncbi:MAG: hypothetical protein K9M45_02870 [Kiritimatiellales bacterium]|nr:hypothetical protein [Kiritimatiellales bacterium]
MTEQLRDFELATREYEDIVSACAELALPIELSNRHIKHASILCNAIIKHADKRVDIMTGQCPSEFFAGLQQEFADALDRDVHIRVIVIDGLPEDSPLHGLKRKHGDKLTVLKAREEQRDAMWEKLPHFTVTDNRMYRLEAKHPRKDFTGDPEIHARASFNQPSTAKRLHQAFDQIRNATVAA